MIRAGIAIGVLATAISGVVGTPAAAQVLDAVYRGTLVCDRLAFTGAKEREAIEVTIAGGAAHYTHVVRLNPTAVEAAPEKGDGTVTGQNISLKGSWSGGNRKYEASYTGSFVRRTARLNGSQTWTDGGKTITRACSGAIKRPLKPFMPRAKKTPGNT